MNREYIILQIVDKKIDNTGGGSADESSGAASAV